MAAAKELREMTEDQLAEHLRDARAESFNLRFQHATGELENTARLAVAKRELARTLTIAAERGIDVERELRK